MPTAPESPQVTQLMHQAKELFSENFPSITKNEAHIALAPGRVNLIGEHTDYTGGFVLPFAIDYVTVVYGTGKLEYSENSENKTPVAAISYISSKSPNVVEEATIDSSSVPPKETKWTSYVIGTVFQYLPDLPKSSKLSLSFAIAGNCPIGSGLSSSASLEVSVARFTEAVLGENAFSSEKEEGSTNLPQKKIRALRCQKAENEWCNSPCGIMDQYVASAGTAQSFTSNRLYVA